MSDGRNLNFAGINQSRRRFLVSGLTVGGGFLLGIPAINLLADSESKQESSRIGFYVEIQASGKVIIGSAQPEIGQGVKTALPNAVFTRTAFGHTWLAGEV